MKKKIIQARHNCDNLVQNIHKKDIGVVENGNWVY